MARSLLNVAKRFAGFLCIVAAATAIIAFKPSWAEAMSRDLINLQALAVLICAFVGAWTLTPRRRRPRLVASGAYVAFFVTTMATGVFLLPTETRNPVDLKPSPAPVAPRSLLNRLRAPWSSDDAEHLPAALDLARCALAAYEDPYAWDDAVQDLGFSKHVPIDKGSAKGVVMIIGEEAVIAFQGTDGPDDVGDWFVNLNNKLAPVPDDPVHEGFLVAYRSVRGQVHAILEKYGIKHAWITGHSLGGAMAVLCALDLEGSGNINLRGVMTFGQPLLLAPTYARLVNQRLAGCFLRFINEADVVPRVAPGLRGGGSYVWFKEGEPKFGGPMMRASAATDDDAAFDDIDDDGPVPLTDEEFAEEKCKAKARLAPAEPGESVQAQALPNSTDHQMQRYVAAVREHFAVTNHTNDRPDLDRSQALAPFPAQANRRPVPHRGR